jgi:hypothetical protein
MKDPPRVSGESASIITSIGLVSFSLFLPLVYGTRFVGKTDYVIGFSHLVGRQPFVFPCVPHTEVEAVQQMMDHVRAIDSFLILKEFQLLKPDVVNELSVNFLQARRAKSSPFVFATCTADDVEPLPEQYQLAFRPIHVRTAEINANLYTIFTRRGIEHCEAMVDKLEVLLSRISTSLNPPLSSVLTTSVISHVVGSMRFHDTDDLEERIHSSICVYLESEYGFLDLRPLTQLIEQIFRKKTEIGLVPLDVEARLVRSFASSPGVILLGPPLAGKSTVIRHMAKEHNAVLTHINPLGMSFQTFTGIVLMVRSLIFSGVWIKLSRIGSFSTGHVTIHGRRSWCSVLPRLGGSRFPTEPFSIFLIIFISFLRPLTSQPHRQLASRIVKLSF